jgi:hypothetical protein
MASARSKRTTSSMREMRCQTTPARPSVPSAIGDR